jgi:hypothetical protein
VSADWQLPWNWNATAAERAREYPCDRYLPQPQHAFFRAIDVDASPAVVYRWLKQLRIAPYSYDWADNFLIPSPARLTPRAATIVPGQRMMHILRILELEEDRSLTLGPGSRIGAALFGELYGTYSVTARTAGSRLVVKVNALYPRSFFGRMVDPVMPWIDLAMMRKQLLRLKSLAERARPG